VTDATTGAGVHGQVAASDLKTALLDLLESRARGFMNAKLGSWVAGELGISERTLRSLVAELRLEHELIGTTNGAAHSGYFMIASESDLSLGTSHLRSRAIAMFRGHRAVHEAARSKFGDQVADRLFSLEELDAANGVDHVNGYDPRQGATP
jgi:hypothetical protein